MTLHGYISLDRYRDNHRCSLNNNKLKQYESIHSGKTEFMDNSCAALLNLMLFILIN